MKTELQKRIATLAPSINVNTIWEYDPDLHDIRKDCGLDDENPDDWQAWQSEVCARTIHEGEMVERSAYLGGTWERVEDHPSESNPDISGYEIDMTTEALKDLQEALSETATALHAEIKTVLALLEFESTRRYDEQQGNV